jgi:hypothetical protein
VESLKNAQIRLSKAFYKEFLTGWLILGLIFGGIIWIVGLRLEDLSSYISEKSIQKNGIQAISARASGDVRTTFPLITLGLIQFSEYDLDVVYQDDKGLERSAKVHFNSMSSIDQNEPPVVWYSRNDPTQIALSWAVNLGVGRLAFASFHWLLGVFVLGLIFIGIRASLNKIANYRACVADFSPNLFEALSETLLDRDGRDSGLKSYKYVYQKPDGSLEILPIMHSPLLISKGNRQYVLGFESPKFPQKPIIASQSLYEFELSNEQRDALINFGREPQA